MNGPERRMTRQERIDEMIENLEHQTYLTGFDFSMLMQELLISEYGYVIDTGNWENVNAETARLLYRQIQKHPLLWKWFFMVA